MPINFELDFVQPLLKDLQNGSFKDVEDFANGVTKYYVRTIEKGAPIGIPPTLPAPAASGAPAPVGTGTGDSFRLPFNDVSKQKFNRAVFAYFNTKELILQKGNLEQKKRALEGIIRKAKYQKELIQGQITLIKTLTQKVKELPIYIKELGDTAKEMYASYKADLLKVVDEIEQIAASDIDVNVSFKDTFPEEYAVIETLKNLEFKASSIDEIRQTFNNILTVTQYIEKANRVASNENETKRYIKKRLSTAAQKIVKIVTSLIEPESFSDIMTEFIADKSYITEATKKRLRQADQAVEAIKFIKFIVEPQIAVLKKKIEIQKTNIKTRINKQLDAQKEAIAKKASEITGKKLKSERVKLFEKYIDDAKRLKKENEANIIKAKKTIKLVATIAKEGTAILAAGTKLTEDVINEVETLKTEFKTIAERTKNDVEEVKSISLSGSNTSGRLRSYLTKRGLEQVYQPINAAVGSLTIDFIDIRKLLEKTDNKYDQYEDKIFSLEDQFIKIENAVRELQNLPKKQRPARTKTKRERRARNTLITVLQKLDVLLLRLKIFMNKQLQRAEKFANEQIAKAKVLAKQIEIAIINSLPIPEELKDVETRRAAIEEKKETIKQYKVKLQQTKQKIQASALLASNAVLIGQNLAGKDFSSASNEQPLQKIANAKFQFFTVGVDAKSATYKKQEDDKKRFLKEITTLKQIETLVSIATLTLKGLKDNPTKIANGPTNFVEELKRDLELLVKRIQNQPQIDLTGAAQSGVDKSFEILRNFIEGPTNNPKGLIATITDMKTELKGRLLSEVIKPVSFGPPLMNLEQKYLIKVKKLLAQMIGAVEPEEEEQKEEDRTNEGLITSSFKNKQEAKERKLQAAREKLADNKMYKVLRDMYKILNEGRGSFVIFLIEKITELLERFEVFVRTQIDKVVSFIKKEVKGRVDKEKKQYEDRLQAILKKKLQNDLIPQSITYNIASLLFWTGAVWTNTTGATFQVITIPPFKKLRIDGRLEGTAPSVRELAKNFESQLTQMQGLCIPNPATGIPPFPFTGYK